MLVIVACFAWVGGWLSTGRLDQTRMIGEFEAVNGPHPGFRRNHAKGVCLTGWFDSSGAGARLSKAVVFKPGRVPVFGRFALAGGIPMVPDGPNAVREPINPVAPVFITRKKSSPSFGKLALGIIPYARI